MRLFSSLTLGLATGVLLASSHQAQAAGAAPQPSICVRSCWGARAPSGGISQMSALTRAIVHHTAGSEFNTTSFAASASYMRGIQNYHMNTNGWSDIGYHFLIDKFGNIFEGRNGSMGSLPRGAHDAANTNSFGFTCMGYFHPNVNNVPTSAMMNSLYAVIAWRMPNGWSPYGSPGGTYGNLGNTVGRVDSHRRVVATACPGDILHNTYIGNNINAGAIRDQIAARINPPPSITFGPKPSLVVTPDGRMSVFAVGTDGSIYQRTQSVAGGAWGAWVNHGGSGFTKVQGLYNATDGLFAFFGIGPNSPLWFKWQNTGGSWSAFTSLGGSISDFHATRSANGTYAVACVNSTNNVQCIYQTAAWGSWSSWVNLGGTGFTRVNIHSGNNSALSVLGVGNGSPLWQWEQSAANGAFTGPTNRGGQLWQIDTVRASAGTPIVFGTSAGGSLTHAWQNGAGGGWSSWVGLGGSGFERIDACLRTDGILVLYGFGNAGNLYTKWQTTPGGSWSNFALLDGSIGSVAADVVPSGALVLFSRGSTNGIMWHRWQSGINGSWSAWADMGCCFQ